MTVVDDLWAGVEAPWRDCFTLAFESFQAGSVPVGAVVVGRRPTTGARGRNPRNEPAPPAGQRGGRNQAHAEVNALAALPPGDYADHVLYSTLEPCLLCTAAARHSHVGVLRFAAADPLWTGIGQLPALNGHLAHRWPRRQGPLGGPLGRFATLLYLVTAVERGAEAALERHRETAPELLRSARALAGPPADRLRSGGLTDALAETWKDIKADL